MKKTKLFLIGATILALMALVPASVSAASQYGSHADAVAGLTGRTVQSVVDEHWDTGKTYGQIAEEAGKLEEFKKENLEIQKDRLAKKVADGKISQERADEIIKAITENQQNCDGTGKSAIGKNSGSGFGCDGHGRRDGTGRGQGHGRGHGGRGEGKGGGGCDGTGGGRGNGDCRNK